jgi:hypothetical protein
MNEFKKEEFFDKAKIGKRIPKEVTVAIKK